MNVTKPGAMKSFGSLFDTSVRLSISTLVGALLLSAAGVSHGQTDVRDLDNPARQPFQAELQRQLRIPVAAGRESSQVAEVPAGKRLVIEHVSFRVKSQEATLPGSSQPRFRVFASLVTKANGVAANHELIVNQTDFGAASSNAASQPVRAYADPGSLVFVRVGGQIEDRASRRPPPTTALAWPASATTACS